MNPGEETDRGEEMGPGEEMGSEEKTGPGEGMLPGEELPLSPVRSRAPEDDHAPTLPDPPQLRVIRSQRRTKTAQARMIEGDLVVRIPAGMSPADEEALICSVVARFERKWRSCHVALEPRARQLAARFGLPEPQSIRWSSRQRFRWGSCSSNNGDILISSRLANAPPWVLDHVIVHELAHLVFADHSADFHALVKRNPDADKAEGYLLALGDLSRWDNEPAARAS